MAFNTDKFIAKAVEQVRAQVGKDKAIIGVSGGVDSSVAAVLVQKAVPGQLACVFVDTGLMRLNEAEQVSKAMHAAGVPVRVVDASQQFYAALKGVTEPEQKRKVIGGEFIKVFEKIAKEEKVSFLVQGTIAPDWIESGGEGRDKIKSHHNVGGLPEKMRLKLCEPLRDCYKHEVRLLARALGLPPELSERQPFPGPGLGVRIIGDITPERVLITQKACAIVEKELEDATERKEISHPWQYFAALLASTKTVGVRGDERAYQYTVVIRAVDSLDGMTANFSPLPPKLLQKISARITNEIREVGRVFYDVTNKPPATVEME